MVYKLHNRVIAGLIALMFVVTSIGLATLIRASATDETGYKIDVVYNNDKSLATLQGKLEEVKPNIELGTIVDKDGVESSALDFTKEITENGEYSFTLKYSDYNDQKNPEREKEIKVKVDGIKEKVEEQPQQPAEQPQQPSEQPSEQQTVQSSEQPSEQPQQNDEVDYTKEYGENVKPAPRTADAVSLDVLKASLARAQAQLAERAVVETNRILFKKYYTENAIPIGQTFNFTGGQLNEKTLAGIDGAQMSGRKFDRAVFKDTNSETEYVISGIYPHEGKWYYTVGNVNDLEGNVGYELKNWALKEFRAYYKVTTNQKRKITINSSFDQFENIKVNGYTKAEIDKMGGLQVLQNEKVVVEFTRANRGPNVQVIVKNLSNSGNKYVFDTGAMQSSGMGERAWDKFTSNTINNSTRYSGIFTVEGENLRIDKWYYNWTDGARNVGVNTEPGQISASDQNGSTELKFTSAGGQTRNVYNRIQYSTDNNGDNVAEAYETYSGRTSADKTVDGRKYAVGQFNPNNDLQFVTVSNVAAYNNYAYLPSYLDLYVYINSNWSSGKPTNHYRLLLPQKIDTSQTYNLDFGAQITVFCNTFYIPSIDSQYMQQKFTITVKNMEHNFLMDLGFRSSVQENFKVGTFQGIDKSSTIETKAGSSPLSQATTFIWADGIDYIGVPSPGADVTDGKKFFFNVAVPYGYAKPTANIAWRDGGQYDLTLKSRSGNTYRYELKDLRGTSGDGTSTNISTLNFSSVPVNFKPVYKYNSNHYQVINPPDQNYTTANENTKYSPVNALNMAVKNLIPKALSVESGNASNGFFTGYDLWVKRTGDPSGGGLNMQYRSDRADGLWHPDDIIDIQKLYNQLRDGGKLLDGVGDYILEFNVRSGGLTSGSYIKAKYEVWTQKVFGNLDGNVSSTFANKDYFKVVPKDVFAYKGSDARLFGYKEFATDTDGNTNKKYILNNKNKKHNAHDSFKPQGPVENSTTPFARLTYMAAINVQLDPNTTIGSGGTNIANWNKQKEMIYYTAVNNSNYANDNSKHAALASELLSGLNPGTNNGKAFAGWRFRYGTRTVNGKTENLYLNVGGKTVFKANDGTNINFYVISNDNQTSTSTNPDFWQKLFNGQGTLYIEAVWEEDIRKVLNPDGNDQTINTLKTGYKYVINNNGQNGGSFDISADFKYEGSAVDLAKLKQLLTQNKMRTGLLKSTDDGATWQQVTSGATRKELTGNSSRFTVAYSITESNIQTAHKAKYRIICWTTKNHTTTDVATANGQSSGAVSTSKVPAQTTQTFKLDEIVNHNATNAQKTEILNADYDTKGNANNDNGTITVKAQFKYNTTNISAADFTKLKNDNKIKVRLYKKDPDWVQWGDNNGGINRPQDQGGGKYPVTFNGISDINTNNKTFTVTFTVTPGSLSFNDNKQFKVACWTDENTESFQESNLGNTVPTYGGTTNVLYDIAFNDAQIQQPTPSNQYIYQNEAYTVTANFKFKANTLPTTYNETRIKELVTKGKIKVALYKQDPGDNGAISKWLEGLTAEGKIQTVTPTVNRNNKSLSIVYTLKASGEGAPSLSAQYNDGAIFHTLIKSQMPTDGAVNFPGNSLPTNGNIAKASTKMNMVYEVTSFGTGVTNNTTKTDIESTNKIYNDKNRTSFTVSATFKYDSYSAGKTLNDIKALLGYTGNDYNTKPTNNNGELKIALYRAASAGDNPTSWEKWADNTGATNSKPVTNVEITADQNGKTFTVTYTITPADLDFNDNYKFRVFAWTKANDKTLTHDNISGNNISGDQQKAPTRTDKMHMVGIVQNTDSTYNNIDRTTVNATESQSITISSTFNYANGGVLATDETNEIKAALYKQETNSTTWTKVDGVVPNISVSGTTITVSITITGDQNYPWHVNDKTKYRIVAWTASNGDFTAPARATDPNQSVGTDVPANTYPIAVGRRFTHITNGTSQNGVQNINLVTGNEVHSSVKDFNTSHLDNQNINVNLAEQRFKFDVTAFKDNNAGEKIKDRWKTINFNNNNIINGSNKNVTVTGTWTTNGLGQSLKTTQDGAKLTAYFWGDRVKLKGTYSANNASNLSNIDIYIDGELQEKAFNVKHESQSPWENAILFDSGYIGYKPYSENKSELHKIEIVSHIPNSSNDLFAVYLNGIEFVTDHYLGPDITDNTSNTAYENTQNRTGRVFYDYTVTKPSTKATDKLNITVESKEKTHTLLDQVKFKITASNMKNGATGEANAPATSTHTLFNVYSKVTDVSGTLTEKTQTLDTLNDTAEITFESKFIYDGKIDQPRLDELLADGTIKAAYFKQNPDKKNAAGEYVAQPIKIRAVYNQTLQKNPGAEDSITSMDFEIDPTITTDQNKTGIKVIVKRPAGTTEWDNNAIYKIFLWSTTNDPQNTIGVPDVNDNIGDADIDPFIENSKGKIPSDAITTKFVRKVYNQNGELGDYPGDAPNPDKTPIVAEQNFNLDATFKYDLFGLDKAKDIDYLLENNKLKIAVYKKNPDGQSFADTWDLWAISNGKAEDGKVAITGVGGHGHKINPFTITTDSANKTFTVTVPIINANGSVTEQYENGARYRIYCWVEGHVNGNKTGTVSVPQFMKYKEAADTPDNQKPSVVFAGVPSRTHIIEVQSNEPAYYVKVPSSVSLNKDNSKVIQNGQNVSSQYVGNKLDISFYKGKFSGVADESQIDYIPDSDPPRKFPNITAPDIEVKVDKTSTLTEITQGNNTKLGLLFTKSDGTEYSGASVSGNDITLGTLKGNKKTDISQGFSSDMVTSFSFYINAIRQLNTDEIYRGTLQFKLSIVNSSATNP